MVYGKIASQSQKRLFSDAHFLYLNQLQQSQGENNPIQLINKHNLNTFTMISHQLFLQTSSGRKHPRQSLPCCHHFQTFVAVIFSLDISPYSYGAIVYKVVNTKKQTVNSTPFQLRASDLGSFFSKVTTQNSVGIGSEEGRINLILTGSC